MSVYIEEDDMSPGFFCAQSHPAAHGTWLVVGRYDEAWLDASGIEWVQRVVIVLCSDECLEFVFPAQDVHVLCDPRSPG